MPTQEVQPGVVTIVPALYEHACRVFDAMTEVAKNDPEYPNVRVYEGHLTRLFNKLGLSVPYYSTIKNKLTILGCIEQARRGGGSAESKWLLWRRPELEEWKEIPDHAGKKGNTITMLMQGMRALNDRVTDLERQVRILRGGTE